MPGEGHDIIVIDDDSGMSRAIERLLVAAGWGTRIFRSAESFLDSGFQGNPELLIVDIQLPGMSGPQLHRHLTESGVIAPVIYITGHDHPYLRNQAEEAGAVAYFTKPFRGEQLISAVRQHLSPT